MREARAMAKNPKSSTTTSPISLRTSIAITPTHGNCLAFFRSILITCKRTPHKKTLSKLDNLASQYHAERCGTSLWWLRVQCLEVWLGELCRHAIHEIHQPTAPDASYVCHSHWWGAAAAMSVSAPIFTTMTMAENPHQKHIVRRNIHHRYTNIHQLPSGWLWRLYHIIIDYCAKNARQRRHCNIQLSFRTLWTSSWYCGSSYSAVMFMVRISWI